jgi:PhoPQ-activated pathogenicity-related protein
VTEEPIWHHFVTVAIPDTFTYTDAAMLYIGNGNKNEE